MVTGLKHIQITSPMKVELKKRTVEHVRVFWAKVQDEEIQKMFPFATESLEVSLALFNESLAADAKSHGQVIYFDDEYIGDIWCYDINLNKRFAMLSIVIFSKMHWGKGIAAEATRIFVSEVFKKYDIDRIGAFTFSSNGRSINLLNKVGFSETESFIESGIESKYFEFAKEAT